LVHTEDFKVKKIFIYKEVDQESFNILCSKLTWISELEIELSHPKIKSLESVSNLDSLSIFKATYLGGLGNKTPIDLTPLSGLKQLKSIGLSHTKIENVEVLGTLSNLTELDLGSVNLKSYTFISKLEKLKILDISGVYEPSLDYSFLSSLKQLEELDLSHNRLVSEKDLQVLSGLRNITNLNVSSCEKISNLDFLSSSNSLLKLDASRGKLLVDISGLASHSNLEYIDISKTAAQNISAIEGFKKITDFKAYDTNIESVEPLRNCRMLRYILLSGTNVSDIEPLFNIKIIRSITLPKTVPENQISKLKEIYPKINVRVL
jgi:Leucine-rich repeat (LRR) protein